MHPVLMIGREASGRHDAMHVRMPDEGLAPGVEDAQEADLRAEVSRIGRDLKEGRRTRPEQQVIQARGVAMAQRHNACGSVKTTWT